MSQVSIVDIEGNNPQIPTRFNANVGFAIPIANVLEILATTVAAGSNPARTIGSGNTIETQIQLSQAITVSDASAVGLAAFDDNYFSVDANGFVSLIGGVGVASFNVDAATAPGTDPVLPIAGVVTVTGAQVAAGTTTNVIRTHSTAAGSYTIEVQRSSAQNVSTVGANGVSHFNDDFFTVDANGFVSIAGGAIGQTITGNTGGPLSPVAGNWNIVGTGSITTSGVGNTLTAQLTGLTNHAILVGAGTGTITKVSPSATSGVPLISQGSSANPTFGTAVVAGGGTGVTTITGLVSGNGTNAFVGRTITGTANQVIVTNGSGATANPTISLASTIYTNISFDSGTNTLNSYSSGAWTPTVSTNGVAPTITYGVRRGEYVKIGRLCYLTGLITFSSLSGGSGQIEVRGLPYAPSADTCFPFGSATFKNVSYSSNYTCCQIQDDGGISRIQFTQSGPSSALANCEIEDFTSASEIGFSICYQTSS